MNLNPVSNTVDQLQNFSHDRLSVYNFKTDFHFPESPEPEFESQRSVRYKDALHISLPAGEVWLFDYGVAIFWGVDEDERQFYINRLLRRDELETLFIEEHFRFSFETETKINKDTFKLPDHHLLTRLAVSHGLAQSIKLMEYEIKAQTTIIDYSHLPKALADTGKIDLNRKQIAKIRGHLFSTKSDIILHYGLLDTPDFFWEYPEYEMPYNAVVRYLEIHQRIDLLSKKLATIHELFEMLADEQKHQHSSVLEWIIIWLIAIEVVIFLGEKIELLF